MNLRALVIDGQVWGIGFDDESAFEDACREFQRLSVDRSVDQSLAPRGAVGFEPITLEHAKRVANGDRRTWPVGK